MMSKKHYEGIAEAVADVIRPYDERAVQSLVYEILDNMCDYFESDNPRFDRARFLEACADRRQQKARAYCNQCERDVDIEVMECTKCNSTDVAIID